MTNLRAIAFSLNSVTELFHDCPESRSNNDASQFSVSARHIMVQGEDTLHYLRQSWDIFKSTDSRKMSV